MRQFKSETAVIAELNTILNNISSKAKASFYSDKQEFNSTVRESVFKIVVAQAEGENILNSLFDIGEQTDRGLVYVGSKSEHTESGEVRYLLFQATINPKLTEFC